ncbi:hypothetical protein HMPREF9996_01060 [Aggregatibacter actinomycetemcomitans Y4]|nr:hypothetical protein HMPREF9996_01060 [Aggregatibacter actinomycetemcomitans Y4]
MPNLQVNKITEKSTALFVFLDTRRETRAIMGYKMKRDMKPNLRVMPT